MFDKLSDLAVKRVPFLFYTDFKAERLHIFPLDELKANDISYTFDNNLTKTYSPMPFEKSPIPFETYKKKFNAVIEKIKSGETYLLNLTQPTTIHTNLSLDQIYERAHAAFKLRVKDEFVCFSPERFVRIEDNRIITYPMKGTIDANIPDAEQVLLNDPKEMAEHIMIVDLLRNDLGIVATDIQVEKFRYTQKIKAGNTELIQVSSKISGLLVDDWRSSLGQTIKSLLPAGSISGTPKKNTVKIIEEIENYTRDYYSGVFGIYDGEIFDSAVMIRFIENDNGRLVYKSGGGITIDSHVESEYNEMLNKIYLI